MEYISKFFRFFFLDVFFLLGVARAFFVCQPYCWYGWMYLTSVGLNGIKSFTRSHITCVKQKESPYSANRTKSWTSTVDVLFFSHRSLAALCTSHKSVSNKYTHTIRYSMNFNWNVCVSVALSLSLFYLLFSLMDFWQIAPQNPISVIRVLYVARCVCVRVCMLNQIRIAATPFLTRCSESKQTNTKNAHRTKIVIINNSIRNFICSHLDLACSEGEIAMIEQDETKCNNRVELDWNCVTLQTSFER